MLKVVQITDCHVSAGEGPTYRGEDPRRTLEPIIAVVRDWAPDLVLATGDLSEDGSEASYTWLAGALERIDAPIIAATGNHDEAGALLTHFPICAVTAPLVLDRDWRIVVLGTAKPGEIPGRLDSGQLEALDEALAGDRRPTLIALHHQPWSVGSPWIDKYPLLEPERFHETVRRHPEVRLVLWGHVHQDVRLERDGVTGLGGPSSVSNSLPGRDRFTPDPAGPACRWLELEPDGAFRTGLLRPKNGTGQADSRGSTSQSTR